MKAKSQEIEVAIETVGVKNKKFARRLRPWGGVIEDWPAPNELRVNFGRWKPFPDDDRKRGVLKITARPGDVLIVCEVGLNLPAGEQRVKYYSVVRDKVTHVVALQLLSTVVEARRQFLRTDLSATLLVNEDSGKSAVRQLRAA